MKPSQLFEGENSSLKKTFDNATEQLNTLRDWEKKYREKFEADYAEWGREVTTDDAIDFIKSLLSEKDVQYQEEIRKLKKPTVATVLAFEAGMKEAGYKHNEQLEEIAEKCDSKKEANSAISEYYSGYNAGLSDASNIVRGYKEK